MLYDEHLWYLGHFENNSMVGSFKRHTIRHREALSHHDNTKKCIYLHVDGHLSASIVSPAVVVTVAVRVDDAGLAQVPVPGPEGGQVLTAREPPMGELWKVGLVRGLRVWRQEQGCWGLSSAVLVMELLLRPISSRQMKEWILEGKRVAHGGGLLLLLLG